MIQEGQIVLFKFPQTDLPSGKLRPALVIRKLPGRFDDWLICMISSQLSQRLEDFDVIVGGTEADFETSGLKTDSVIRVSRLAVVSSAILLGSIGTISEDRLSLIRNRIVKWIQGA